MIFKDLQTGKFKLIFGDWDQIRCIDKEIQRIEEERKIEEHGGDGEVMKSFKGQEII